MSWIAEGRRGGRSLIRGVGARQKGRRRARAIAAIDLCCRASTPSSNQVSLLRPTSSTSHPQAAEVGPSAAVTWSSARSTRPPPWPLPRSGVANDKRVERLTSRFRGAQKVHKSCGASALVGGRYPPDRTELPESMGLSCFGGQAGRSSRDLNPPAPQGACEFKSHPGHRSEKG